MRNSLICLICSLFFVQTVQAETLFCGTIAQGEILRGQTKNAQKIILDDHVCPMDQNGEFLCVLGRDAPQNAKLIIQSDTQKSFPIAVQPTNWDIQKINGVEQRKVTPSTQDEAEIQRESHDVRQALTNFDDTRADWQKGFILPVEGRISGHFGNQRIFNGVPKNPHTGTDIAVPEGTPVKASADGLVLVSGGNYFYGGNMVILDHGMGLQTIYMHLQKANVKIGDRVHQGEIIGLAGKTGRATGAHLHWGASLDNVRFRPHGLLNLTNAKCINFDTLSGEKQ